MCSTVLCCGTVWLYLFFRDVVRYVMLQCGFLCSVSVWCGWCIVVWFLCRGLLRNGVLQCGVLCLPVMWCSVVCCDVVYFVL